MQVHERANHIQASESPRSSGATRVARLLLIAGLIPVALLYLLPRISNLVATPYRLDAAVVHADAYNTGLHQVVSEELVTLKAFDALDQVKVSLADVRGTDAEVARQLALLVAQITGKLQQTLESAHGNVGGLLTSLDALTSRLKSLNLPVDGASRGVMADRASLQRILDEARRTAAEVKQARTSAEKSADHVSGK